MELCPMRAVVQRTLFETASACRIMGFEEKRIDPSFKGLEMPIKMGLQYVGIGLFIETQRLKKRTAQMRVVDDGTIGDVQNFTGMEIFEQIGQFPIG
jgi:hypothetical protein